MKFFLLPRRWPMLALLVLILAIPLATQELRCSVQIGYDGYFKEGHLVPIWVTLANSKNHTQVRVAISRETPAVNSYVQEVSMPAPSVKKVVFYLRLRQYSYIWLQLQDLYYPIRSVSKKIEVKKVTTRPMLLIIQAQQSSWQFRHPACHTVNILPNELPDHFAALGGFDIIMLARPLQSRLTEKQFTLLQDWVNGGGTLIVADIAGAGQHLPEPLAKIVPSNLRGQVYRYHDVGHGRVVAVAAAVDEKTVSLLLRKSKFCRNVLRLPKITPKQQTQPTYYGRHYDQELLDLYLSKVLKTDISLLWVAWLIVVYLICIGPLDYFLSKRSKCKIFTWISFSLMIALFSFLAYTISRWFVSGQFQVAAINCLDVFPQSNRAIGRSFFGIYSTKNTSYRIDTHPVPALVDTMKISSDDSGGHLAPATIQQQFPYAVTSRIPIYSYKTYMANWSQPAPLTIEFASFARRHTVFELTIGLPDDLVVESPIYVITASGYYQTTKNLSSRWQARPIAKRAFIEGIASKVRSARKLLFRQGKNVMKFLSCSAYSGTDISQLSPYERAFDLSSHLNASKAIVLLFVDRPLTTVRLQGEFPDYRQINLLRLVIPFKE